MSISYTAHALERMKQRSITADQVEQVLYYPDTLRKAGERRIATGTANGRKIQVVFTKETHIKIITVI